MDEETKRENAMKNVGFNVEKLKRDFPTLYDRIHAAMDEYAVMTLREVREEMYGSKEK
jgi:hypothetical protein